MADLCGLEAPILEKTRLSRAFGERGGIAPELAPPDILREAREIVFGSGERGLDIDRVHPAQRQLALDAARSKAAFGPIMRIGCGEPTVVLQAGGPKPIERCLNTRLIEPARRELTRQLLTTVLATGESRDGELARLAAGIVAQASASAGCSSTSSADATDRGMAWARTALSTSFAIAGLSFRYWRTFSLPWPSRSPL